MKVVEIEYRGFRIVGDGTYGQKLIKQRGSGDIPGSIKGSYTTAPFAKKAIDSYLDQPTPKQKAKMEKEKNAEVTISS